MRVRTVSYKIVLNTETAQTSSDSVKMTSLPSTASSNSRRVTLERNGKRVELQVQQVTTEILRRIFQVCIYTY